MKKKCLYVLSGIFFIFASLSGSTSYGQSAVVNAKMLEEFENFWGNNTIGLVYDSVSNQLRYAHENSPNPCLFDVKVSSPHDLMSEIDLHANNSSWEIAENLTGAGFDPGTKTFFLTDFQGDYITGSNADDYIIEVDTNGTILNAWEMDDGLGSNDSSDGSRINGILDIAVVPGTPTRYFVTAANDGGKVYEISLIKTGTWWSDNSWSLVQTHEGGVFEALTDNYGIDYDADTERLYHSDGNSDTILVTDLNMEPIAGVSSFTCAGAGGFNSGVTFIEGSNPAEIWVTDFSSDMTTRCQSPAGNIRSLPFLPLLLLNH